MRELALSAMNKFPSGSKVICCGERSLTFTARPESPLKPDSPPATVLIALVRSMRRIRLLRVSAMNRLPTESKASEVGPLRVALTAWPPSPLKLDSPVGGEKQCCVVRSG